MNVLFSLLLLLAPLRAETGKFTITVAGNRIGTEEFSITPRTGGYLIEGHTMITAPNQKADLKSRMELNEALKVTAYEFQSSIGSIHLKVSTPLSELEYVTDGEKHSDDIRFPADGAIVDSNFFHHYAVLLYRLAAMKGTVTIPTFVPQDLQLASLTIKSPSANTYEIDSGSVKVVATTDKDGRLIRLTVPDAKVVVER
jgi:hypothetical protein